ncbi:hypothetical protein ACS0TY_007901 [Phlomoides rotata]
MGFYEALSWLKGMDIENVIVEGDAKIVVKAINSSKDHFQVSPYFSIVFAKRDVNMLAHEFAIISRLYGSSFTWVDPSNFVDGLPTVLCRYNNEN